MQLTEVQLGRAGAEAEAEASSSANTHSRRLALPSQGLPCGRTFRVVSSPRALNVPPRCLAPAGFWSDTNKAKERVGYHQRLPGCLSPESWV